MSDERAWKGEFGTLNDLYEQGGYEMLTSGWISVSGPDGLVYMKQLPNPARILSFMLRRLTCQYGTSTVAEALHAGIAKEQGEMLRNRMAHDNLQTARRRRGV
jgi:hypothetical protein